MQLRASAFGAWAGWLRWGAVSLALACEGPGTLAEAGIAGAPPGRAPRPDAPAIAVLLFRAEARCTATLVGDRVLLTAAHCLEGGETGRRVLFPGDRDEDARRIVDVQFAEGYDRRRLHRDLGLLRVDGPPTPRTLRMHAPPALPSRAIVIGFGGADRSLVRRTAGSVRVTGRDRRGRLHVEPAPGSACRGDSGAPILDGSGNVVAVVSAGAENCQGRFVATALDPASIAWVRRYVRADREAEPTPLGGTCAASWDCGEGLCARPAGSDVPPRCARPCAGIDLACPPGLRCVAAELRGHRPGVQHGCFGPTGGENGGPDRREPRAVTPARDAEPLRCRARESGSRATIAEGPGCAPPD